MLQPLGESWVAAEDACQTNQIPAKIVLPVHRLIALIKTHHDGLIPGSDKVPEQGGRDFIRVDAEGQDITLLVLLHGNLDGLKVERFHQKGISESSSGGADFAGASSFFLYES